MLVASESGSGLFSPFSHIALGPIYGKDEETCVMSHRSRAAKSMRKARTHLAHPCRNGSSPVVLSSRSMMPPREHIVVSRPMMHEEREPVIWL